MDYMTYESVLEYIPIMNKRLRDVAMCGDHVVYTTLHAFCTNYAQSSKRVLVSLSGGVDSMVVISVIHHLGYDVVAAHINYNNRYETLLEQRFLENWCEFNKIPLYTRSIIETVRGSGDMSRSDYEELTKNIRFSLYKEVMEKETCDCVVLGHHKDDTVENILTNICRARSILNLAVIKSTTCINDVRIERPLVNVFKHLIFDFAHQNGIPYFKDTTPSWSVRGILRNFIMPSLQMAFQEKIKNNLLKVNQETSEWNQLIHTAIIDPYMSECEFSSNKVTVPIDIKYIDYPFCFWNLIFMKVFYKYNLNCPSNKSVYMFMKFIKEKTRGAFALTKSCSCFLENNRFSIIMLENHIPIDIS